MYFLVKLASIEFMIPMLITILGSCKNTGYILHNFSGAIFRVRCNLKNNVNPKNNFFRLEKVGKRRLNFLKNAYYITSFSILNSEF